MQENETKPVPQRASGDKPVSPLTRLMHAAIPVLAVLFLAGAACGLARANGTPERTAAVTLRQASGQQTGETPAFRYALSDKIALPETDTAQRVLFQEYSAVQEQATGLYVDGQFIGALRNEKTLQNLLDSLLESAKENNQASKASFLGEIKLVPGQYARSSIVTLNAMCSLVQSDRAHPRTYTVVRNDTAETIAKNNSISVQALAQANPGLELASLHEGDVIRLEAAQKVLSIQTEKETTVNEPIPYQKVTKDTADLYVGETKLQTAGVTGNNAVTYHVTTVDGVETKREVAATKQTVAMVNEVTLRGVRERPAQTSGTATGAFVWPTPTLSIVTSGYGARWGTFHYGLDISGADASGQPIVAADGGTVAFAGSDDSGYGTYVVIDHGNGYRSYYGHMTKELVRAGDKVAQGQLIGLVGSTGNSTGPHCHFEVRKGDERIDPTKLVNAERTLVTPYLGQALQPVDCAALAKTAQEESDKSVASYRKAEQAAEHAAAQAKEIAKVAQPAGTGSAKQA